MPRQIRSSALSVALIALLAAGVLPLAPPAAAAAPCAAGAWDDPDEQNRDSNCDGVDGTIAKAVFVSPKGNNSHAGTRDHPLRSITNATALAATAGKTQVLVAGGEYNETGGARLVSSVGVYGGYNATTWQRAAQEATIVLGRPQAMLAVGAVNVVVQRVVLKAQAPAIGDPSAYGIRAFEGSSLRLEEVTIHAGPGRSGTRGLDGEREGVRGETPTSAPEGGSCSGHTGLTGGGWGALGIGGHTRGGDGGRGGNPSSWDGSGGAAGGGGASGGAGGRIVRSGDSVRGVNPSSGASGANGAPGQSAVPVDFGLHRAGPRWAGVDGRMGSLGEWGAGGGGGGGGYGVFALFDSGKSGQGGWGGTAGGGPGSPGEGGTYGGGSFGVYLHDSVAFVHGNVTTSDGGTGGHGGLGRAGGNAKVQVSGSPPCSSTPRGGAGGAGGNGGRSGDGGGGTGGPSVGIMLLGTARATSDCSAKFALGKSGVGGGAFSYTLATVAVAGPPGTTVKELTRAADGINATIYPKFLPDNRTDLGPLLGYSGRACGTTANATAQLGESVAGVRANRSVWYGMEAPANGSLTFQTKGNTDTRIALYTGHSLQSLGLIASNDNTTTSNESAVEVFVLKGQPLLLSVDSRRAGPFELLWALDPTQVPPTPPARTAAAAPENTDATITPDSKSSTPDAGPVAWVAILAIASFAGIHRLGGRKQ